MRKYLWMGLVVAIIGAFAWAGSNTVGVDQNNSQVTAKQSCGSAVKTASIGNSSCGSNVQKSGIKTASVDSKQSNRCCASGKIKTDVKTTMAINHKEKCDAMSSACTAKKSSAGVDKTSI